jgi:hypothetical protein
LLQHFYSFATIAQYVCYWVFGVSGEFSGEFHVDVSDDILFCYNSTTFCYAVASEVSGGLSGKLNIFLLFHG